MKPASREWATPLTIGAFSLMAVTGTLMFFHVEAGAQKAVHEWLGWLLVAAVAAHASANWPSFKRHLQLPGKGRWIVAASLVALLATFVPLPAAGPQGPSPPALAMRAITGAPLASVAPLAGKSVEQARADLAAAGIVLDSGERSIAGVVGSDRERMGRAVRALFAPR